MIWMSIMDFKINVKDQRLARKKGAQREQRRQSTKGGNLNHYKHKSNGKELVSTWGELTNQELLVLDGNRNGPEARRRFVTLKTQT